MTGTVWSVNILLGIGLLGVIWFLYYILTLDKNEEQNTSDVDSSQTHK